MKFNSASTLVASLIFLGSLASSCKKKSDADVQNIQNKEVVTTMSAEDKHIQVQHILIGFKGSLPGKNVDRTQEQAEKLAKEVLAKAQGGGDYDALVKQYTDDSAPGVYGMSNRGVAPEGNEFPRDNMVPAFGDVGFTLKVGEIGLAPFDKAKSPFGYHIIKRMK